MKKIFTILILLLFIIEAAEASSFDKYINDAFAEGIISGDESGDFQSEKPATRAEFAQIAVKFLKLSGGVNIFSDVRDEDWFAESMSAAAHNGILAGYEDGMARPYNLITCEEAVTILGRFYRAESRRTYKAPEASDYAKPYFAYAAENGLLTEGSESYTDPKHFITKGEVLALLYKYDKNSENIVHFLDGYPKISDKGVFNNISVELKTSSPCTVYYGLAEQGGIAAADIPLCEVSAKNMLVTANIVVNINKTYDLYLKAVSETGASGKTAVIKNIHPFTISQGNGTEQSPYIIYTAEQLKQMADKPDKFYRIGSDIVLSGDWTPIPEFTGVLDGNGCTVSGISTDSDRNTAGIFEEMSGTVRNLSVSGSINAKNSSGIIAGKNYGTIENCTASGNVSVKNNYAGGICGENYGEIKNCLAAMYAIESGMYSGGISGQNIGKIEECLSASDKIFADMYSGGISGINKGEISGCAAVNMNVSTSINRSGGRITTNRRTGKTERNYCYSGTESNLDYEGIGEMTQSGADISWDESISADFYYSIGWKKSIWKSAKNGFRLPYPSHAAAPVQEAGKTIFTPIEISTSAELMNINKNESGHYVLVKNITLDAPWKTICTQNGFSGSLDGNGYSIYNMKLKTETGMFSNIAGGTVRNLNIADAYVIPDSIGSVIAACNYGRIENCRVSAEIDNKRGGLFGTVAAENFGEIRNCSVRVKLKDNCDNSTIGGICANNSGMIIGTDASLALTMNGESTVFGGICGYDTEGYIFESFARADITSKNKSAYYGGICGIAEKSRIYKCASMGNGVAAHGDIYAGGVCAMSDNSVIYNCYSAANVSVTAQKAYAGGVVGYAGNESNVQNTYSCGNIIASGSKNVYSGGICGYSENSFIMQNVSANPAINSSGFAGAAVSYYTLSEVSDNYSCEKTLINSKHFFDSEYNGTVRTMQTLKNADFYFRPVAQGGLLGWEKENVWTQNGRGYSFPVLTGVNGQDSLKAPQYK